MAPHINFHPFPPAQGTLKPKSWLSNMPTETALILQVCQSGCVCSHSRADIQCMRCTLNSSHNLLDTLARMPRKVEKLEIENSTTPEFTNFTANSIQHQRYLRHLSLRNNSIVYMDEEAIRNLPVLRHCDLSLNKLETFSGHELSGTPRIETLNLSGNALHNVSDMDTGDKLYLKLVFLSIS